MSVFHSIPKSFGYAIAGIKTAIKNEPNFRVHMMAGIAASGLGLFLGLNTTEWAILILTIVVVVVLELINTAIEAIVNLVSPQLQEAARVAKDTSAAAVLLSALGAVAVGVFLFLPKIFWLQSLLGLSTPIPTSVAVTNTVTPLVVAENLDTPWEIAFLEGGDMMITERRGKLTRIGRDKTTYDIKGAKETGEGGLLGLALKDNQVYLYLTTVNNVNQVVRYDFSGDQLTNEKIIVDNIPAGQNHNGGRLKFGPDGALYVTTGETGKSSLAQDKNSLAGKILRVVNERVEIYSYGHRNPQGLAWDTEGNLWATEHGRSGVQSGYDELNIIKQGANYGWPAIEGDKSAPNMESPVINSGPTTTWAPAGMAYLDGNLYFAGLRGETLYQYSIVTHKLTEHLQGVYGRLRAVSVGPDGYLYASTSNNDGRGTPKSGDDKILKIDPKSLQP